MDNEHTYKVHITKESGTWGNGESTKTIMGISIGFEDEKDFVGKIKVIDSIEFDGCIDSIIKKIDQIVGVSSVKESLPQDSPSTPGVPYTGNAYKTIPSSEAKKEYNMRDPEGKPTPPMIGKIHYQYESNPDYVSTLVKAELQRLDKHEPDGKFADEYGTKEGMKMAISKFTKKELSRVIGMAEEGLKGR